MKMDTAHKTISNTFRLLLFIALLAGLGLGIITNPSMVAAGAAKIYVVNYINSTISQANLDGSGGVDLGNLNSTLNTPSGIALDMSSGKMYVVNITKNTISQANLDGSGGVDLGNLNSTLNWPRGIALDLTAVPPKMYVANTAGNNIIQANLDGTGGVSLGNLNGTLDGPMGIALDLTDVSPKMYVTNSGNNTISRAKLDGTGGVGLAVSTLNYPMGIALNAGKMYVVNYNNSTISQANLDGTGGVSFGNLNGTLNYPRGIALDLTAGKMYVTNQVSPDGFSDVGIISQADLDGTDGISLGNLSNTTNGAWGIALGADNTAPTAAITYSVEGPYKSGTSVTLTATFDEAMADSPVVQMAISGSNTLAATNMQKTDSTHYYYIHTVGSGDGTATVALSTGKDLAGNVITSAPTSGATFTVDNTAPTAAITYSVAGPYQSGAAVTLTATFNEAMADSPLVQMGISGANILAATNMQKTDPTHYYYVHTVGSGDGTATVALSTGTDLAGNVITSNPTSGATFTVDNTAHSMGVGGEVAAVNKLGLIIPWLTLILAVIISGTIVGLRRSKRS